MNEREIMDVIEEYTTTDIVMAACLRLQGAYVDSIRLVGKNHNQGLFVFMAINQSSIDDIQSGKVRVDPYGFQMQIKQLTKMVKDVTGQK